MRGHMYAVIATGGKQEKVETGQVLNVELLHADEGSEVTFNPILLVDDDAVMSTDDELSAHLSRRVWWAKPRAKIADLPIRTNQQSASMGPPAAIYNHRNNRNRERLKCPRLKAAVPLRTVAIQTPSDSESKYSPVKLSTLVA